MYYIVMCITFVQNNRHMAEQVHKDMLVVRFPKEHKDLKEQLKKIYKDNKEDYKSFNEFVVTILANSVFAF